MSWKGDSKIFNGPDEDAEYYQHHESKKNARLVAFADYGHNGEPKEKAEKRTRFDATLEKIQKGLYEKAFTDFQEAIKPFESPSVELKFKRANKHSSPHLDWEINNDKVLPNNKLGCLVELKLKSDACFEAGFTSQTSILIRVWQFDKLEYGHQTTLLQAGESEWEELITAALTKTVRRGIYEFFTLKIERSFATIDRVGVDEGEKLAKQFWH